MKPAILLKRRLWHRCFPMNFPKFIRTSFSIKHLLRLLLHIDYKIYRKTNEEENTKYFSHAIFCNLNHCQFSYKILYFLQIIIQLKKHLRQNQCEDANSKTFKWPDRKMFRVGEQLWQLCYHIFRIHSISGNTFIRKIFSGNFSWDSQI